MKRIKFNDTIQFSKCRADESGYQRCAYCGGHIGKGNFGLSIIKKCSNRLNVWIHINCMENFCRDIIKFKKDNMKKIILASITKNER